MLRKKIYDTLLRAIRVAYVYLSEVDTGIWNVCKTREEIDEVLQYTCSSQSCLKRFNSKCEVDSQSFYWNLLDQNLWLIEFFADFKVNLIWI